MKNTKSVKKWNAENGKIKKIVIMLNIDKKYHTDNFVEKNNVSQLQSSQ